MFWRYLYFIICAPGVIVHELAHAFFCVIFNVKIHRINLLRFDSVAGYVIHDEPRKFFPSFFISFGPLIINSGLAIWLFSKIVWVNNWHAFSWYNLLYLWLGAVLALQAIPSTGDAKSLFNNANHNFWRNPLVILFYPLVLALYILNFLKFVYIDFFYIGFLIYIAQKYI